MGVAMMNPDLRRKIKVRMRPDLVINQQRYGGQSYFIIKDPVGLRYFRFREEELFLLQQLDGYKNLDDVRHEFVEKFRPQRLSVPELERFVSQLLQAGLATAQTPQAGQRLYERYKKKQRDKLKQMFLNVLYLKVPVFDPERLLGRLMPYTYFLFTIPFLLLATMFGLASLLLVLVNWSTFISKLPAYYDFFTVRNVIFMWITLGVVKVLHEFGHGLSCKRFGGEVHEMGLLFLVFTPCLYCNVTDAWMLPNKWHRAIIGAAGMYVELILSSMFVWIWWYTEPGLLNTLSLSIIFVCSVSTVLFNANPLLRFDGYYILADLAEIPNLRERSNKYLGTVAGQLFLGEDPVKDPFAPQKNRWLFVTYAVAAYLYRILITVTILYFLYTFLRPYKLGVISAMIAVAAGSSMVIVPIYRMIKTLSGKWRTLKVDKVRMAVSIPTALIVIATVVLFPLPMRVDAPLIMQPKNATVVTVPRQSKLENLWVKDGDPVMPGQLLAKFVEPMLEIQYGSARREYDQQIHLEKSYRAMDQDGKAEDAHLASDAAYRVMRLLEGEIKKLDIVVPPGTEGVALSPPRPNDVGKFFKPGDLFCQIGDPTKLEAYIVVPQSEIGLIQEALAAGGSAENLRVWVKLAGHVGSILEARIAEISQEEITELPQALSNKAGGQVPTTTNKQSNKEIPQFRSYAVIVDIDNTDRSLSSGLRGAARFDVGYKSIYWRVKRYIQQTLNFRL
ncbi:peptidase M50 [bacterium]|nr:peptidase M50 [bacterium]